MFISEAFDEFDPLTGKIPENFLGSLYNSGKRARALLKNRSAKEIQAAAQALEWMIVSLDNEHYAELMGVESVPLTEDEHSVVA